MTAQGARRTRLLYFQGGTERAGAERMLYYLLRYLDRDLFEPSVAFLGDGPFVGEIEELGIPVICLPKLPRVRAIWRWRESHQILRRCIEEVEPHLVHANGEKVSIFAGRAAQSSKVPSIAWLHDSPLGGGFTALLTQFLLSRTRLSSVVTCSNWMAAEFNRRFGIQAQAIQNGIDLRSLPFEARSLEKLAEEVNWPRDVIFVSHFARLQHWKGTHIFVKAAARLKGRIQNVRFLIVGGSLFGREVGYARHLRDLADEAGLGNDLLFTGFRSDALEIMAGTDVVVHCSLRPDPFPTVVLEGMAMGKPVIATRTRGPEEALEHGVTGLLIDPSDEVALEEAIFQLVTSEETRHQLGTSAAKVARESFSAERMVSQFQEHYLSLLQTDSMAERVKRGAP